MKHTSYIELSESALIHNLKFIRQTLGKSFFSAVVKGNAYGHGIQPFSKMLYQHDVRHYSVFSVDEARQIKNVLPNDITLLILGFIDEGSLAWVIENGIEFYVFDFDRLKQSLLIAEERNLTAKIHLELETGMNRTGIPDEEIEVVLTMLTQHPKYVELVGVCSHLAGAESIANYKRIIDQIKKFNTIRQSVDFSVYGNPNYHLACSAATLQYPQTQLDMARIGILLYGFFPSNEVLVQYLTQNRTSINPLKRVISWKSEVMDVKDVAQGEFIGYGTSFFTNSPTKIALIPVGYAHGFSRSLSNHGKVLIQSQRFDVIGTVNMNMLAVDISENKTIKKGDEVVLIGKQGELEISVSSFSEFSDMLNYELLTRLPSHLERKIIP